MMRKKSLARRFEEFLDNKLIETEFPIDSLDIFVRIIITILFITLANALSLLLFIPLIISIVVLRIISLFKTEKSIRNIIIDYGNDEFKLNGNLYLENYIFNKDNTLDGFIYNFLKYENKTRNTYYDIAGSILQCGSNRRRSLGDIYCICKTYFPECTIIDVLKVLIQLVLSKQIGCSRCNTINKFVFHTDNLNQLINSEVEYCEELTFTDIINEYKENNL